MLRGRCLNARDERQRILAGSATLAYAEFDVDSAGLACPANVKGTRLYKAGPEVSVKPTVSSLSEWEAEGESCSAVQHLVCSLAGCTPGEGSAVRSSGRLSLLQVPANLRSDHLDRR